MGSSIRSKYRQLTAIIHCHNHIGTYQIQSVAKIQRTELLKVSESDNHNGKIIAQRYVRYIYNSDAEHCHGLMELAVSLKTVSQPYQLLNVSADSLPSYNTAVCQLLSWPRKMSSSHLVNNLWFIGSNNILSIGDVLNVTIMSLIIF